MVVDTLTVVAKDATEKAAMAATNNSILRFVLGTSDAMRFFHMSIVRSRKG